MAWSRKYLHLLTLLFLALLFSGCAAGPGGIAKPAREAAASSPLQQALAAVERQDYQQAVESFDKAWQQEGKIEDEYRYDYSLALSKTGRDEAAISQLDSYLDNLGRRGDNFLKALNLRNQLADSVARQQLEAEKAGQLAANLTPLSGKIAQNWKQLEQQLKNAPTSFTEPLTGVEMVLIKGGCYQMGDLFGTGRVNEQPVHEVCVDDFYLGKYEVTQQQWIKLMGYNPSKQPGDSHPVEMVSWQETMDFCRALSAGQGRYRLPTEAEWEYAARSGGQQQKFSGGDQADQLAWHEENSGGRSHPVGQKQPNGVGLYDMSGNLYEWTLDYFAEDYYQRSPKLNPTGPQTGSERTRRGGSWDSEISYSRTSYRTPRDPNDYRSNSTGFRLALPAAAAAR